MKENWQEKNIQATNLPVEIVEWIYVENNSIITNYGYKLKIVINFLFSSFLFFTIIIFSREIFVFRPEMYVLFLN